MSRNQIIIVIVVMAIIAAILFVGFRVTSKDKPRCHVCNAILWNKNPDQNQLLDIWACNEHWSRAVQLAREEMKCPEGEVSPRVLNLIYRILKDRRIDE